MAAIVLLGIMLSSCSNLNTSPETTLEFSPDHAITPHQPLPQAEAQMLMEALSVPSVRKSSEAFQEVLASGDTRFVPVLIELMRASQIGIIGQPDYESIIAGLEELSGQGFGDSWPDWIEWYGSTPLEPPPGFIAWKGKLLARIDPGFAQFLQTNTAVDLRVEEIVWGGVALDGIPALDHSAMIAASEEDYLLPGEPVFGIEINGDARAYPLRIMDWHEMANDTIGGVPVSLAYCTLCGAGIAFDGRTEAAGVLTFGSSGLLYRSNKLMYDRSTNTLWNQISGEPVAGELVGSGIQLRLLPVVLTSWQDWLEDHPDTLVLSTDTGYGRNYSPGAAYGDYFSSTDTMFPVWQRDGQLATKERIFAVRVEGVPKAYPLELLGAEQLINDEVGGRSVVVIMNDEQVTVEGSSLRVGQVSYQAGGAVRAYERARHQFRLSDQTETLLDEQGERWAISEQALLGPAGQELARLPGHLAYWFGWFAFFPQTEVYQGR